MSSTYGETIQVTPITVTTDNPEETILANIGDSSKTNPIRVNNSPVYGYYTHKITRNEITHSHTVSTRTTKTPYRYDDLTVIEGQNPKTSKNEMEISSQSATKFVPPYYVLAFIMRIA